MQNATDHSAQEVQGEQDAHRKALRVLQEGGFEPMVGGAYALRTHTGIWLLPVLRRLEKPVGYLTLDL